MTVIRNVVQMNFLGLLNSGLFALKIIVNIGHYPNHFLSHISRWQNKIIIHKRENKGFTSFG